AEQEPNHSLGLARFRMCSLLRVRRRRKSNQGKPELSKGFQSLGKLFHTYRFSNKTVCLQIVTSPNIFRVFRSRENDNRNLPQRRILLDLLQNLPPIFLGQI